MTHQNVIQKAENVTDRSHETSNIEVRVAERCKDWKLWS